MASWHQTRAARRALKAGTPIRFDHDTLWSVLINPPGGMASSIQFTDEASANAYTTRVPHSFVLPPRIREARA